MNRNVSARRTRYHVRRCHAAVVAIVVVAASHGPNRTLAQVPQPTAEQEDVNHAASQQVPFNIVVARHVTLLDGQEITTWESVAERIGSLPDPSRAHPCLYVTRGAHEAGREQAAEDEIWKLHQKFQLQGHSVGSLWSQADFRYDKIKSADDLKPDAALQLDGAIVDEAGQPVAEAEVLLITPIDQSIPYQTWHVALVSGRVRNRLEYEMAVSDADGRFALYPRKDARYHIIALHPDAGFGIVSSADRESADPCEIVLKPWAALIAKLTTDPGVDQEASISTRLTKREKFPEVVFDQYWREQKTELPGGFFGFTHVPPSCATSLARMLPESDGTSINVHGAEVTLNPGEIRRLDLGSMTDEQREHAEAIRQELRERSK